MTTCDPTQIKGNINLVVSLNTFLASQSQIEFSPKTLNKYNTHTYCHAVSQDNYGYVDLVFDSNQITGTIRTDDYTCGIYPIDGDPFVHVLTIVDNDNYDGTCTSCCINNDDSTELDIFNVLEEAEPITDDILINSDQYDNTTDLVSIEDGTDLFFHDGNEVTFNRGPICQTKVLVLYTNDASEIPNFWGLNSTAALGMKITDQIINNSEITNLDLNLVGVDIYDLDELQFNNNINTIMEFAANDEAIQLLALEYEADIVVIFTETSDGDSPDTFGTANAFFTFGPLPVVAVNVFHASTPRYAFSHEMLHMYNAGHESGSTFDANGNIIYHPYANAGEYDYSGLTDIIGGDIISTVLYSDDFNDYIPYVTNPDVMYDPPGIFTDEISIGREWSDNARMIEEQSCLVSIFDNAADEAVMNFFPADNVYCYGSENDIVPFFVQLSGITYPLQSLELEFSYDGINYTEVEPENFGLYYWIGAFLFVVDIANLNVDLDDNLYYKLTVGAFNGETATDFASVEVGYCIASEEDETMFVIPESENITFTSELYPNPAIESLTINELIGKDVPITIRSINGATYFNSSNNGMIDISNLVEGIYFLDYKFENTYKSQKFIKSN